MDILEVIHAYTVEKLYLQVIARNFGTTQHYIREVLHNEGIDVVERSPFKLSHGEELKLIEEYHNLGPNAYITDLCNKYGIEYATFISIMKRHNVPRDEFKHRHAGTRGEVRALGNTTLHPTLEMWDKGQNVTTIAKSVKAPLMRTAALIVDKREPCPRITVMVNDALLKIAELDYVENREYITDLHKYQEVHAPNKCACYLCHKKTDDLVIDHAHTTGLIRGLICPTCLTEVRRGEDRKSSTKLGLTTANPMRILEPKNFSNKQEREICKLYRSGEHIDKVARKFNTFYMDIRRVLLEHKVTLRQTTDYTFNDETAWQMIEDLKTGNYTIPSIAKKYNTHGSTIIFTLKRYGVQYNPRKCKSYIEARLKQFGTNPADYKKILDFWDAGKSTRYIARKLGINRNRVGALIVKHRDFSPKILKMVKLLLTKVEGQVYDKSKNSQFIYTLHKFRKLHDPASNCCELCGVSGSEVNLTIDHCHKTGLIRGLICNNCNVGLGKLGEDREQFQRAIDYLTFTRDALADIAPAPKLTEYRVDSEDWRGSKVAILRLWDKYKLNVSPDQLIFKIAEKLEITPFHVAYRLTVDRPVKGATRSLFANQTNNFLKEKNLLRLGIREVLHTIQGYPFNTTVYHSRMLVKWLIEAFTEDNLCCAICGDSERLVVDHCHETGLIRGLLCQSCNHSIGHFKDNNDLIDKAMDYVESLRREAPVNSYCTPLGLAELNSELAV